MRTLTYSLLALAYLFLSSMPMGSVVAATLTPNTVTNKVTGYTVCGDSKIYVLDLSNGLMIAVSKPIKGLGGVANIDINRHSSYLYIASDRSMQGAFYDPLVTVDLNSKKFKVINRFNIEPRFDLATDPEKLKPLQNAVYWVKASPDGKVLYVPNTAAPLKKPTTVIDSQTGAIVNRLKLGVSSIIISPDGLKAAEIWPAGITYRDGKKQVWPGGVAVSRLTDGKLISKVSLTNNQGLRAPWQKTVSPFIYFHARNDTFEVYDRNTGKLLSSFVAPQLTGLQPNQKNAVHLMGSDTIVLSMIGGDLQEGYVVAIDIIKQEVIYKIKVGKNPSNVVIAN